MKKSSPVETKQEQMLSELQEMYTIARAGEQVDCCTKTTKAAFELLVVSNCCSKHSASQPRLLCRLAKVDSRKGCLERSYICDHSVGRI